MARQRAVYRIEELGNTDATRGLAGPGAEAALRHAELMTELRALRDALAAQPMAQTALPSEDDALKNELDTLHAVVHRTKQEVAALVMTGLSNRRTGRVSQQLNAVLGGTESATHRILAASEEIEEAAKTLVAAIKNVPDQDLARDILDQVRTIFEACNFHDLVGQRIAKVSATLKFIEEHILKLMQIWGGMEGLAEAAPAAHAEISKYPKLLNGPKLDGDPTALSQKEIDAMFAARG